MLPLLFPAPVPDRPTRIPTTAPVRHRVSDYSEIQALLIPVLPIPALLIPALLIPALLIPALLIHCSYSTDPTLIQLLLLIWVSSYLRSTVRSFPYIDLPVYPAST